MSDYYLAECTYIGTHTGVTKAGNSFCRLSILMDDRIDTDSFFISADKIADVTGGVVFGRGDRVICAFDVQRNYQTRSMELKLAKVETVN